MTVVGSGKVKEMVWAIQEAGEVLVAHHLAWSAAWRPGGFREGDKEGLGVSR